MRSSARRWPARRLRLAGAAFGAASALAGGASAQTASPPQWQFYVTPYLWIAGVGGSIKTPYPKIPEQTVEASFGDVLSHLDAIPIMGAVEARYGRFGLLTDIIAISVKTDISTKNILFTGGSARLTQVMGTAIGAYRVLDADPQSLDVGVGVRAFGMSTKFTVNPGLLPGFSIDPGASWADPIAAIRYHVNFNPKWGLTAYGDIGGGPDSQLTWQLLGTLDYQISASTTLRLGYRQLQFEYRGNLLHQNMSMSGPVLTGTIRF